MTASPILGITQVSPSQNNKEVTINTAVAALESAMNAAYAVNLTAGNVTLTAAQFASAFMFICSGNTVARNLIVPLLNPGGFAQSRMFCVNNSGSYDLVVKGATGLTATVPATSAAVLFCDGTNVFLVSVPVTVGAAAVLSVAGLTGTITLAQLVTAGLAPSLNASFTGTFSAPSGATGTTPSANDNSTKLATTAYVDAATAAIVQGLDTKAHVRAMATGNVSTSSAPSSIDGVTLVSGDRVALLGQTTGSQNGIYTFASAGAALTRATDADTSAEVKTGMYFWVTEGTIYADTGWILITTGTITLGTTSLSFTQFSGAGQIVNGTGLLKSGNTLSISYGTIAGTAAQGNDSRITGAEQTTNKGAANGYAGLDSGGLVPLAQLPSTVTGAINYAGAWNASTNSPTITSSTGTTGKYYTVGTAGTTTVDGTSSWSVGDHIAFNGTVWEKWTGTAGNVLSVAGHTGTVTLAYTDIGGLGGAAILNVGTTAGTVAAGNDSRITGAEQAANKGVANGYAGLDSGGKVPTSQLPSSVQGALNYQGTWNANTNSPALASSTGTKGFYYTVSTGGTTTIDGISSWVAGDHIAFNGTVWEKWDGIASEVFSVAGKTGVVTIALAADLSDVVISSIADGDRLAYSSGTSKFINVRDPFDISAYAGNAVIATASQVLIRFNAARVLNFAANFGTIAGGTSKASAEVAATASTVFNVDKALAASPNTFSTIGTITFASAGVTGTFATSSGAAQSMAAGDVLRIIGPATPDTTLAGVAITLAGAR